jgi:hypothetical protein
MGADMPAGWDADIPVFPTDAKGMATRVASGRVLNAIAPRLPALVGGSADLDPSTYTALTGLGDFEPPGGDALDRQGSDGGGWSRAGRNLHFGVREHGMGAILNGLAAHGGTVQQGRTMRELTKAEQYLDALQILEARRDILGDIDPGLWLDFGIETKMRIEGAEIDLYLDNYNSNREPGEPLINRCTAETGHCEVFTFNSPAICDCCREGE